MKPWKSEVRTAAVLFANALQWGHGDEAVEESSVNIAIRTSSVLQWGHGDEAVEEWRFEWLC